MDEDAARMVLLVRAVERVDDGAGLITDADRQHAARAASELARWSAGERGAEPSADEFIAKRAGLLFGKITERSPGLAQAARALEWRPWIGVVIPMVALLFGAFLQQVGDRHHINILAFPLLSIVLWNLAVYAVLAVRAMTRLVRPPSAPSGLRRAVLNFASRRHRRPTKGAAAAFASFLPDWTRISAPLLTARAARVLHISAALLAAGAVAGLYVRGLVLDYRAGWESTFLDPAQVHAVLSTLLGPAATALGMSFPTVEEIAALRWPASAGESAARWIHWTALTVAALVIVPRAVLAIVARWRESRLASRVSIVLQEPYYRRLLIGFAVRAARLRVVPFSYTVEEASARGLQTATKSILGDAADVALRPAVAFGSERMAADGIDASDASVALTVALFSLAATPEHENHGVFLDTLRAAVGPSLMAWVDEAPYRRRLGDLTAALDRLNERRNAWSAFCSAHRIALAFVDLAAPDLQTLERDVEPVVAASAAASA